MMEFVAGALTATYLLVLAYVVHEDGDITRSNVLSYIFWPVVLIIGPFTRAAYKRMLYEHREGTHAYDPDGKGWYLRPGMDWNDTPRQVFVKWLRSRRAQHG